MITEKEIIKRIKNNNFIMTYAEAIDLVDKMDVGLEWQIFMGGHNKLMVVHIKKYGCDFTVILQGGE
jgi:hypothetical protein